MTTQLSPETVVSLACSFKTANGFYICAESGGGIHLPTDRSAIGPWETFVIHQYDDGRVSLQVNDGRYVTAEVDGKTVAARATQSGEWERFTIEVRDDTIVAFKTFHGGYLQSELGGGANTRLVQVSGLPTLPGEWEFFTPSEKFWTPVITNYNFLHGEMTRNARVLGDATGPRIVMSCHFMEGFSAFCHNKSIGALDVRTQLEIIAEKYGAVRNLDVLGYWDQHRPGDADEWYAWAGREVTPIAFVANSGKTIPPTPDYWGKKRQYVTMLHELGLKILDDRGDMNSWTTEQKLNHMRENGAFYNSLPFGKEVLLGVWGINEAWQNGGDSRELLQNMIAAFEEGAGWLPAITGLSAPGGNSDPEALADTDPPMTSWEPEMPDSFIYWSEGASAITCHGNRGDHTHIVEHYFGYGYDEEIRNSEQPVENTEPVGGGEGVSVGTVEDPELLCALTGAALLGGQAWTYMSGNGVFWDGPIHEMPGFAEVARLPEFLPNDIATFPVVCHAGTRFTGVRILGAVDPTRCEHAIHPDGRFVLMVHTQEQAGNALPCERSCSEFTVINMLTGEIERSGPLNAGESYQHPGVARLVVGQLEPSAAAATMGLWGPMTAPDKPKRRSGRLLRLRLLLGERGWSA